MKRDKKSVAYFCMEYGLNKDLPIYAGGLGILAGDYLKAAKEENYPLIGIGILWREDYTEQHIGEDGRPYDLYPSYDFDFIEDTGLQAVVTILGEDVKCKIHLVECYNNASLYLLDCAFEGSEYGWITSRLYGGEEKERLAAEMVLGIGGIRALRAMDIEVDRYHFNEGHAVFGGLELIQEKRGEGMDFESAWEKTRREVVFTTHTPVSAGNEVHPTDSLFHIGANNGLSREEMKRIGGDPFSMTVAGLRLSLISNGVSKMHGNTARHMWKDVPYRAPIISITNGVHRHTWQDAEIRKAFLEGESLRPRHLVLKRDLFSMIKERNGIEMDPEILTIGFARRAAPYKRSELIFHKAEVLDPLLKEGKLQLIFSGKAHPKDEYGKDIVQRLVRMDRAYRGRIVFLENYDMEIALHLVKGCDVWLNNPRRPLEASGTSGMKAALNGVLNISVLDGWMAEGPEHGVSGWLIDAIFSKHHEGDEDRKDIEALYHILFEEVVPTYYEDPSRWESMMGASIEMGEFFTSSRMIEEYFSRLYHT